MRLTQLATSCGEDEDCPTVDATDRGNAEGHVLGRVPATDAATVGEFCETRDVALSLATPFPAWLSQAQAAGRI